METITKGKTAVIVFVRTPELGKVKTRLAKTMGEEAALQVYKYLLSYTKEVVLKLDIPIFIYYEGLMKSRDIWSSENFKKRLQSEGDLGQRMLDAFTEVFAHGYSKVIIIGSDCYEITPDIIIEGINNLDTNEIVFGPAADGGYYLLGMTKLIPDIFNNITWSSEYVLTQSIEIAKKLHLTNYLLPVLNDVDEEKDVTFTYK